MLTLRRLAPCVARLGVRPISSAPVALADSKSGSKHDEFDDDVFELLPPGASLKDPLYGHSPHDKINVHDRARSLEHTHDELPPTPTKFVPTHISKKKEIIEEDDEEDRYVYLPPGSSLREPGDSLSDAGQGPKRVYYRDPNPE